MSEDRATRALRRLAASLGVQPFYRDLGGHRRQPSLDALLAAVCALGETIGAVGEAPAALAARRARLAARRVEPVAVAWERERGRPLRLSTPPDAARVECRLRLEGGKSLSWKRDLGRLAVVGSVRDGAGGELALRRLPLPRDLPRGYHRLSVGCDGGETDDCLVIVAPRRAYGGEDGRGEDRERGVLLPLYAWRADGEPGEAGVGDLGVGDFGGLERLGRWVGGLGGSTLATLPLLAAFLYGDDPFEYAPYAPASRLFWNELYVDPRRLPELARSPAARQLLASAAFRREAAELAAGRLVDYRRAAALKRRLLAPLAAAFFADGAPEERHAALERLRERRPELDDYAAFRATVEHRAAPWQSWPAAARDGVLAAVEEGGEDFSLDAWRFHLYAQLAADEQLAAAAETLGANAGGGLLLDLPLGVHPSSYDVWRRRDLFVTAASVGAPPDDLFSGGQDWGFHPLHPERQREQGYRHLIAVLRHHLPRAGVLRIDHAMHLHRLYWIPDGVDRHDGVYVRYPSDELYAVLALESHRTRTRLVGENLGTVPRYVDRALSRHGVRRMFVLPFAVDPSQPGARLSRPVASDEVASLHTHDMPTFRAYWEAADVDEREATGLLDAEAATAERRRREEERSRWRRALWSAGHLGPEDGDGAVLAAALAWLGESAAPLVLVDLEDLWREREPQNVPGTWRERPNWRRRAALTLAEMAADRRVTALLERLEAARRGAEAPPPLPPETAGERREEAPATAAPLPAAPAVVAAPGERIVTVGAASLLSDDDLHLFNEGRHFRLYDKLGAHRGVLDGAAGYHFAVWAPDAQGVSVVGDFNGWDRDAHPLVARATSGIWEGFLPGALPGHNYKFHVRADFAGYRVDKADPFAKRSEVPPKTGSILWHLDHEWDDDEWMAGRGHRLDRDRPVSIYEVHLGSWRRRPEEGDRSLSYREIAAPLAEHVERCGFTHVELLPVMEHPFYGSWGYQTTGYFAPTARYGTPQDLMVLIGYLHRRGIGVLLDWVPSHFPSDEHALGFFDGTHLFEHSDPRLGYHPDWNSFIFNYARHEVRSFLISSALFWLDAFHADGLRVDAVASMLYRDYSRREGEWIPNVHGGRENLEAVDFLRQLNAAVYEGFPGVETFAEESTSWPLVSRPVDEGGLGFGYKWDMGWMHDTLTYMARQPVYRRYHQNELTFRSLYAFNESYCLPLSHDEVVHGKGSLAARMPGDGWQQLANLRLLYGYMWLQPAKKLLFMGGEIGQRREWAHESSLDWHLLEDERHRGLMRWVSDLNRLYRAEPALHELDCEPAGFEWIDANDHARSILAFLRRGREGDDGALFLAVFNFIPQPHHGYRFGVPRGGRWEEVLNGDGADYGGSGVGNLGAVVAAGTPHHGRPFSLDLTLPPLAMVVLRSAAPG